MGIFKGTSGMWIIEDVDQSGQTVITNSNGDIAIAFIPNKHPQSTENTNLITCAPELLHACQEALKELQYHNLSNTKTGFLLTNVIDKALGL